MPDASQQRSDQRLAVGEKKEEPQERPPFSVTDDLREPIDELTRLKDMEAKTREIIQKYQAAMREMEVRFEILDQDLNLKKHRNPIHHVESRIKKPASIFEKLGRYGKEPTLENMERYIMDIAGVRVICSYIHDVYNLLELLRKQDDLTIVTVKDYIADPKPNGYRSLHLIVETPIFLHDQKRMMRVEVQFRTISMDWWASLEHKIRYKKDLPELDHVNRELFECAQMSAQLDARMEKLQRLAETAAAEQHADSRWGERRSGTLTR